MVCAQSYKVTKCTDVQRQTVVCKGLISVRISNIAVYKDLDTNKHKKLKQIT